LKQDPIIQRAQPVFMQTLCLGSFLTSTTIFTLSWDEDAGWTNHQLSIACSLTPWFFYSGHILVFSSLFIKLWRVDRVFQFNRSAVTVGSAMLPLLSFLAVTLSILLAQTIYDPWSWSRHIIKEIPAETYGKCQSQNAWAFFGPLTGIIFLAEGITLFFAWRTVDAPSDFRDAGSVTHACLAFIQAWAVGVPMLLALGSSSADATYFARISLTWIFSITSVGVVVCPKIYNTLKYHLKSQLKSDTDRRGSVSGLFEQSGPFGSNDLTSDLTKSSITKSSKPSQSRPAILTKAEMCEIYEASRDECSSNFSVNSPTLG